ncbi:phosphonate ABC transporter, permease protein PhnE [Paenibacillus sp. H1-7]|uniref:phosphonate ABC transporter, permease protein PhnE n=1 Tax=Paenibacillus sp. H1-7 TaxID=2282849 RepID=UPI001EF83F1F|nr:phosphonate ABC transporter, permease protein PhnE [Paenibacillus sp. H1-7]ULL15253.1 phosphonate ABC transporter, permease protein PhnE [Paenibacillus sp. H1-7]
MSSEWVSAGRQAAQLNIRERLEEPKKPKKDPVLQTALVFGLLFFGFSLYQLNFNYVVLFQGTWKFVQSFALMFPPNASEWKHVLAAALETLQIALVGTVFAVLIALVLSFFAARNLSPRTAPVINAFASFLRAIPTLVWALIFIVAVGMGPFPGILAICTHAAGMLIKVFAQSIEEVDEGVIEALRASGASWLQNVCQGVLPCVATSLLAWSVFRLEVDIGESSVLGVVGAGGIGFEIANAMRAYEFDSACFVAIVIFAMVFTVELCSNRFKTRIRRRS